jgi:hypothetical protein
LLLHLQLIKIKDLSSGILGTSLFFTGPHTNKFLAGYVSSGTYIYSTTNEAQAACKARNDCNGVTSEYQYTLRQGVELIGSPSGEISWLKTPGNNFTGPHNDKFLASYVSSGTYIYATTNGAQAACKARNDCNGVTSELKYTLRQGVELIGSSSGEISWLKTINPNLRTSVLDIVGMVGKFRKVRVQLEGTGYMHVREVQVIDNNGVNLALNKIASQSSLGSYPSGTTRPASNAVDGSNTDFGSMTGYEPGE